MPVDDEYRCRCAVVAGAHLPGQISCPDYSFAGHRHWMLPAAKPNARCAKRPPMASVRACPTLCVPLSYPGMFSQYREGEQPVDAVEIARAPANPCVQEAVAPG